MWTLSDYIKWYECDISTYDMYVCMYVLLDHYSSVCSLSMEVYHRTVVCCVSSVLWLWLSYFSTTQESLLKSFGVVSWLGISYLQSVRYHDQDYSVRWVDILSDVAINDSYSSWLTIDRCEDLNETEVRTQTRPKPNVSEIEDRIQRRPKPEHKR